MAIKLNNKRLTVIDRRLLKLVLMYVMDKKIKVPNRRSLGNTFHKL